MNFGKNKFFYSLIIFSVLLFLKSWKSQPIYDEKLLSLLKKPNYRFIAHAGGGIKDYKYTNSVEAVNKSIKSNFKLIEIDLHETRDKSFVGVHNWDSFKIITKHSFDNKELKLNELKSLKIYDSYTPLTIDEINRIFKNNRDIYLLTDKTNNFDKIKKDFQFNQNRILVEVFGKSSFKKALKKKINNPIYNYNSGDFDFVLKHNIKIVSASIINILKNSKEFEKMIKKNIFVFAYSSNEEKLIKKNIGIKFTHVYTDFWDPIKLKCSTVKKLCTTY